MNKKWILMFTLGITCFTSLYYFTDDASLPDNSDDTQKTEIVNNKITSKNATSIKNFNPINKANQSTNYDYQKIGNSPTNPRVGDAQDIKQNNVRLVSTPSTKVNSELSFKAESKTTQLAKAASTNEDQKNTKPADTDVCLFSTMKAECLAQIKIYLERLPSLKILGKEVGSAQAEKFVGAMLDLVRQAALGNEKAKAQYAEQVQRLKENADAGDPNYQFLYAYWLSIKSNGLPNTNASERARDFTEEVNYSIQAAAGGHLSAAYKLAHIGDDENKLAWLLICGKLGSERLILSKCESNRIKCTNTLLEAATERAKFYIDAYGFLKTSG
jgi:hypothetical protein